MLRDTGSMDRLIVLRLVKSNRESVHRTRRLHLHEGDYRRAIDSSGQKCAERHIRHHALSHDGPEQPIELVFKIGNIEFQRVVLARLCDLCERPPAAGSFAQSVRPVGSQVVRPYRQERAWRELEDTLIDALLIWNPALSQHHRDCSGVHRWLEARNGSDCLKLRREKKCPSIQGYV